jgi:hypothetical protein
MIFSRQDSQKGASILLKTRCAAVCTNLQHLSFKIIRILWKPAQSTGLSAAVDIEGKADKHNECGQQTTVLTERKK